MLTVLDSLNSALHEAFKEDERVVLLGEDILDPYGGAFKVTHGLSTKYPDRIITTPVSEAGIVGVAAGMAIRGFRPVVEIMFGDFTTLIADQLINHIAKFRFMYNDQVQVPIVIRTPMGGRRGYGPTHSQTLEKIFLGVPGLRVLAANSLDDPGSLLYNAILHDDNPVLFIEHKLLYNIPYPTIIGADEFEIEKIPLGISSPSLLPIESPYDNDYAQTFGLTLRGTPPPQLTLVSYGYMAELCRIAIQRLAYESEIFVELVVPNQLSPFAVTPIARSVTKTGRILVVEEGTYSHGWGAEILARMAQGLGSKLTNASRLAARDSPIPASLPIEEAYLPGVADILQAAKIML